MLAVTTVGWLPLPHTPQVVRSPTISTSSYGLCNQSNWIGSSQLGSPSDELGHPCHRKSSGPSPAQLRRASSASASGAHRRDRGSRDVRNRAQVQSAHGAVGVSVHWLSLHRSASGHGGPDTRTYTVNAALRPIRPKPRRNGGSTLGELRRTIFGMLSSGERSPRRSPVETQFSLATTRTGG